MNKMNRRQFIGTSAMSAAGAFALLQIPQPFLSPYNDVPIGFQTFPIRDILAKDFAGTLKMMAGLGYKQTEMCSPKGYESIGYGPLVNMKPAEMKSIINDAGLT